MIGVRRIGVLGGMSWESSALYYRLLNQGARDRLGGLHSADLILRSVDFADVEALFQADDWDAVAGLITAEAVALQNQGAELVLLATNTVHMVADQIQDGLDVPLLHIADVMADAASGSGCHALGLLGTRFTMSRPFYADRLAHHGITSKVPDPIDQELVDRIIFDELVVGRYSDTARAQVRRIMGDLHAGGADGIALACTELELLVDASDSPVPLFASTALHVSAALDAALERQDCA